MTDHDDLSARLALLTDARPEPPDPAAPVRLRIKRRQRRRTGFAFAGAATATTLAVLAGSAIAGTFADSREPGVAGFGLAASPNPSPSAAPEPGPSTPGKSTPTAKVAPPSLATPGLRGGDHSKVLPPPWSAKKFTKLPDANAYRPRAYYIAEGRIPTEEWAVLAYSRDACLVADEGPPVSFGRPLRCWSAATASSFAVYQGFAKEKAAAEIGYSLVLGVAPITARKVRIAYRGGSQVTDAVATPATDKLRFFAVVIAERDLKNVTISPLDAAGRPAGRG